MTIDAAPVRAIYQSEGYNVCLYKQAGGGTFTAVGADLCVHCKCTLHGKWVSNKKYGRQFSVSFCEEIRPEGDEAIAEYLTYAKIKHVGPVLAKRIVAMFHDDTYDALSDPERLSAVRGISKAKAREIADSFAESAALHEYFKLVGEYGIPARFAQPLYHAFRDVDGGAETLKARPYLMCEVDGITFDMVERHEEGRADFKPYGSDRVMFGILEAVRRSEDNGSVFARAKTLVPAAVAVLKAPGTTEKVLTDHVVWTMSKMKDAGVLVSEFDAWYRNVMWDAEAGTAEKLTRMMNGGARRPLDEHVSRAMEKAEAESGLALSDAQRDALRRGLIEPVSIITGGPGRGKTAVLRALLSAERVLDPNVNVALCAPTGRAAQRMTETSGYPASTIHHLLGLSVGQERKRQDMKKTMSGLDLVIVDEASMADMRLFYFLVDAMPARCRFVLIGDADQLESVQPGNVLRELVKSRTVPTTFLDENFRQGEGSAIVRAADRINRGEGSLAWDDTEFRLVRTRGEDDTANAVIAEVDRMHGSGIPFSDIQVLSPYRRCTKVGAVALNGELQKVVNPQDSKKPELTFGSRVFREGDRVIHLNRNEEHVSNGDIGHVFAVDAAEREVTVLFPGGVEKVYTRDDLTELDLAYAMSVHKSQGSEYPHVVMPFISVFGKMRVRRLLYTALTRAKKSFCLVGTERDVAYAASNTGGMRDTYLAYRMTQLNKSGDRE